ncbi:flavin reductase family protein [Limosilactobacillus sp. STM2_1]|uniref:Flavin reductase family protein n=1 Tax=Limosilactobacillus rudii TaxID=2759755 RepID=A0A7W3UL77_9LACO|nr:flavin reductase family protein [Limosilactobacillus rudii]MBB1079553.1 flavin reductase family protein [Limosilactobacillus rudii]MBB1097599.1 flavin reductase family protein [Limosilactobacillus rudii]MCD7134708.1 flavin reductase family protein [Limosilactobacillus rudii]
MIIKKISSKALSAGDNYKLLSGLIIPRTVAWVSTLNEDGESVNLAPFSFFSSVPSSRPLITLGIGETQQGKPKDTVRNILREKEAIVQIPNENELQVLNKTAATLPYGESEVIKSHLQLVPSNTIKTPAIADAPVRLETKLYKAIPVDNQDNQQDAIILLMEVVDYLIDDTIVDDRYHIDIKALNPIARLAGPNYGRLGEIYQLERPDYDSQPL